MQDATDVNSWQTAKTHFPRNVI